MPTHSVDGDSLLSIDDDDDDDDNGHPWESHARSTQATWAVPLPYNKQRHTRTENKKKKEEEEEKNLFKETRDTKQHYI